MTLSQQKQFKDLSSMISKSDITRVHFNQGHFCEKPFNKKIAESTIEFSITNDEFKKTEIKERNVTLFVREVDKNAVKCALVFDNVGWTITNSSSDKLFVNELVFRLEGLVKEQMPKLFYRFIEGK